MAISAAQLNFVADSLRLVMDVAGVVQPGSTVGAQVVSSLSDLNAVDTVGPTSIPLARPVDIEVSWHVHDESGMERWLGVDFVSTGGLGGTSAGFIFKPPIVELTYGGLATQTWEIRARVTVSAEGVTSPVTRGSECRWSSWSSASRSSSRCSGIGTSKRSTTTWKAGSFC
jgi:hypothetical protein